jgi:murein L,D-transpeptidase YafK
MLRKLIFIIMLLPILVSGQSFYKEQMRYSRFRDAVETKSETLISELKALLISTDNMNVYIEALKYDKVLNVYVKSDTAKKYKFFRAYPFCYASGTLGPKRKQGDLQVPEGIYYIDRYNPYSAFHLSLGINYPNASDRILGNKSNLGGDIFLHGNCVSLGCIAITDEKIKELYLLNVWAKNSGQNRVPVHIYPISMTNENYNSLAGLDIFEQNKLLWQNLKNIYNAFHNSLEIPNTTINQKGEYVISD